MGPLHFAALMGLDEAIPVLISHGASPYVENNQGRIPLNHALRVKSTPAVRALLKQMPDKNINDFVHHYIRFESDRGDVEGPLNPLRYLISLGADVLVKDKNLRSLLHLAASEGHCGLMAALLSLGADPDDEDVDGMKPLNYLLRNLSCYKSNKGIFLLTSETLKPKINFKELPDETTSSPYFAEAFHALETAAKAPASLKMTSRRFIRRTLGHQR